MRIERLTLQNFRNYREATIDFSEPVTVFSGLNGSGKTNLLEAIFLLSNIKSFRFCPDRDLLNWGSDYYFCRGNVAGEKGKSEFSIGFHPGRGRNKKLKINGNEMHPYSQYYGKFITIILHPGDSNLITGNPDNRRRYGDSVITKLNPWYMNLLNEYRELVASRNALLKDINEGRTPEKELDVWDQFLSDKGTQIVSQRASFAKTFNRLFSDIYREIAGNRDFSELQYVTDDAFYDSDTFNVKLTATRKRDISAGMTLSGPHRDDYSITGNNGRQFSVAASQGQIRSAAISMKLAEKKLIENSGSEQPVVLIDDIFSELDDGRKKNFLEVAGHTEQIIMTMVNLDGTLMNNFSSIEHFIVDSSGIVKKNEV